MHDEELGDFNRLPMGRRNPMPRSAFESFLISM